MVLPVCDDFATEVHHSGTPRSGRVLIGAVQVIHTLGCQAIPMQESAIFENHEW